MESSFKEIGFQKRFDLFLHSVKKPVEVNMKSLMTVVLMAAAFTANARKALTAPDIMKSAFCKEYACDDTSPYKDKDGRFLMQLRLAKDPLNLDLLVMLNGSAIKKLTFKFTNDEGKVDRKALSSLLTFLLGHAPADKDLDKIIEKAAVKTKKDELANNEKLPVEDITVVAGKVLKKPTIIIDL
jgi:hypothetical protein